MWAYAELGIPVGGAGIAIVPPPGPEYLNYYFTRDYLEDAFLPKMWHHICLSYNGLYQIISGVLVS